MSLSSGVCNLTASADRLRLGERDGAPRAFTRDGMSAEIIGPHGDAPSEEGPAKRDALYVVIAGSGVIESDEEEIDFTTGDVLFAPAGVTRRFARLSQKFRAWKLSLRPM